MRFYHFPQTFEWGADNTRDFLVAKHIVKYGDFKWIAPWSFGSGNYMVNSVFYYYLLAIFYLFSFGNLFIYQFLFILFFFVVILIFSYLFGKLFFKDHLHQYLFIILFSLLPIMNVYGRGSFQPHFVLPFLTMSLYYYFSSFQKKSLHRLSLAVFFYSISLNIHYSLLVILPWIVGMTIYLQYYFYVKKHDGFKWKKLINSQLKWPSLILFLNFYFLLMNQLIIKGFSNGLFFLSSFFTKIFFTNLSFYFHNLSNNFHVFWNNLIGFNNPLLSLIIFYSLVLFICYLFILKKKTFYSVSLFLASSCILFTFFINYYNGKGNYPSYYFAPFYIIVPLFLMSVLSSLNKKWRSFLFVSLFLSVLFFSVRQFVTKVTTASNQQEIDKYKIISDKISKDVKKQFLDHSDFFVFTINDQLDWSSAPYWLYLENDLNLQLVKNTNFRYNIISINELSQNVYLICDNPRISWNKNRENMCLERFTNNNFLKAYEEIYSIKNDNLSVYRLLLNKKVNYYAFYNAASFD